MSSHRWTVGPAALAVLALAGCAQGGADAGHATGRSTATTGATAAQAVTGVEAAAVQRSYATTVATGSVTVHLVEKVSGGPTGSLSAVADGAVDFVHGTSRFTVRTGTLGTSEVRLVGGKVYAKLPSAVAGVLDGKTWVELAAPGTAAGGVGGAGSALGGGVTDQLAVLRGLSSSVSRVGTAGGTLVDGVATTEYLAQVDRAKVLSRSGLTAAGRAAGTVAGTVAATIPVHVWIDAQGRTRRLALTVSARPTGGGAAADPITVSVTETLSGFGVPVSVTAPPASQTTDLGSLGGLGGALSSLGAGSLGGSTSS